MPLNRGGLAPETPQVSEPNDAGCGEDGIESEVRRLGRPRLSPDEAWEPEGFLLGQRRLVA
jgi:hypothetical protein